VLGKALQSCTYMLPVDGKPDKIDNPDEAVGYCQQYSEWRY
jgi:hypothetical protein